MTNATATLPAPNATTPDCEQTGTPLLSTDDAEIIRRIRLLHTDWQTELPTQNLVGAVAIVYAAENGQPPTCGTDRSRRLRGLVQAAPQTDQTGNQSDQTADQLAQIEDQTADPPEPAEQIQVSAPTVAVPDTDKRKVAIHQTGQSDRAAWLRLVPPVTALGTAFVLQIIIVTDTLGHALSDRFAIQTGTSGLWWFALAGLFGLAVSSSVEGSAAYLLHLYDKHLLAGDSVWMLRIAMIVYVGASAGVIHWWADKRDLPTGLSWLLAGMAASSLFLWMRGSRWKHREVMRASGQIDPAMPRLPMAAKLLHPYRWLVTLYLVSWEPVATTDEARARFADWQSARAGRAV